MPTQSQDTQTNSGPQPEDKLETSQAQTGSAVREGQENSSINSDKEDEKRPVKGPMDTDDNVINQEEFLEDRNTVKKSPDE